MDIENSEYQTLLGSTKFFKVKKPSWIVEVHPRFYSKSDHKLVEFDKIFQLFWENDYASYLIAKETILKIDQSNYANIHKLNLEHNHNYLFIDKYNLKNYQYLF